MLYVDIPTLPELKALAATRADACVSIYLPTTPVTQDTAASRIELKNLTKVALGQLEAVRFDKRRLAVIGDQLAELADDDGFWKYQAMSLAVLVTPDAMRTFRLPNRLTAMAEVSDRFHLKPLLRAITFPHETFVLALSENAARLVEAFADLPAQEVKIRDLPKDGADALKRQANDKGSQRISDRGKEGEKDLLRKYARQVDAALRAVLAGRDTPLILAATEPLASIFRSVNTYPGLVAVGISASPDRMSDAELAAAARPILDRTYARDLEAAKDCSRTERGKAAPPAISRMQRGRQPMVRSSSSCSTSTKSSPAPWTRPMAVSPSPRGRAPRPMASSMRSPAAPCSAARACWRCARRTSLARRSWLRSCAIPSDGVCAKENPARQRGVSNPARQRRPLTSSAWRPS